MLLFNYLTQQVVNNQLRQINATLGRQAQINSLYLALCAN